MIEHTKEGGLHLITMQADSICPEWQKQMLDILDVVAADHKKGTTLILTGLDKSFCKGLNLQEVMKLSPDEMKLIGKNMKEIHRRMLMLPFPTIAAMNGHAFAAGAFIAMSLDYRLMREDRGWFCISEVDVGVPIPNAMMEMLRGKLPPNTARDALLTGKRYGADEAIAAGIADEKASMENLIEKAKTKAIEFAEKEPSIFKNIKQTWHKPMADAFEKEIENNL